MGARRRPWRVLLLATAVALGSLVVAAGVLAVAGPFGRERAPVAGVAGWQARHWQGPQGPATYAGAVHVHSELSADSHVPLATIAAEARALGLAFLVVTDHDAPPRTEAEAFGVVDDVLVVRGAEWSTDDAHVVDLGGATTNGPFKLAADAVTDCLARGGPCLASHPTSWRRQFLGRLQGLDGMEVHSAMTALGDMLRPPFAELAVTGFSLLAHPAYGAWKLGVGQEQALDLYRGYLQVQPWAATCGADVHGVFSVAANLRAFVTLVAMDAPLSADPVKAGIALRRAILDGTCANANAGWVDGLGVVRAGDRVVARGAVRGALGETRLVLQRDNAPYGARVLAGDAPGEVDAAAETGTWEARLVIAAPTPWGVVERVAARRFLRVEDGAAWSPPEPAGGKKLEPAGNPP